MRRTWYCQVLVTERLELIGKDCNHHSLYSGSARPNRYGGKALPALSETDATCKIACLPPLLSRIWSAEYSSPFSLLSFAAIADRSSNVPFVSVYLTKAKHHNDAKAPRRPRGCLCAIASVLLC